jgi:hypothetical protein
MESGNVPTELVLQMFSALDSLEDVISLSTASRRLRSIWTEHSDTIYRAVALRSIEGEKHARALHQTTSNNTKITAQDALSIMHRANYIESMTQLFTDKIVQRLPYKRLSPPRKHLTRC